MTVHLTTAAEVDRDRLDAFLARSFRPAKAAFLREHGDWWHRGPENRWLLEEGCTILGYCAVMPTEVTVGGVLREASWWVDLVIDPAARGRKLQRLFDDRIRAQPLTLGFPNAVAAAIHRRHGWGVREDLRVRMLPLVGSRLPSLQTRPRLRRLVGPILSALGRIVVAAGGFPDPSASSGHERAVGRLFSLVGQLDVRWVTTARTSAWFRWRYRDAPWPDQLRVFEAGASAAVARVAVQAGETVVRILDLVGVLDPPEVRQLVGQITQWARRQGAVQVVGLAANRITDHSLARAGMFLQAPGRSCWYSPDREIAGTIGASLHHWTFGDADHDEP